MFSFFSISSYVHQLCTCTCMYIHLHVGVQSYDYTWWAKYGGIPRCGRFWVAGSVWPCHWIICHRIFCHQNISSQQKYILGYILSLNGSTHLARENPVAPVRTCLGNWVYMYMGATKFTMFHVDYRKRFINYVLVTVMSLDRKRCLCPTAYTIFPQIKGWSTIFSSPLTPGLVFRHGLLFFQALHNYFRVVTVFHNATMHTSKLHKVYLTSAAIITRVQVSVENMSKLYHCQSLLGTFFE